MKEVHIMKYNKSKKLINDLLTKEINKQNDNVEILAMSTIDFILKKLTNNICLRNLNINDYIKNQGLYNWISYDKYKTGTPTIYNIVNIHLDVIKKDSKDKYEYLYNLLTTLYHEYYHRLEYISEKNNQLDNIKDSIETFIKDNNQLKLYYNYHDNFNFEINANLYSIKKTEEYLKQYPNVYKKLRNKIEYDKVIYQLNYINYDIQSFFNYINKNIKQLKELPEPINILYDKEYNLNPINELYKAKRWITINDEIKKIILSSKSYIENQNIEKLSQEERTILLESLKYAYYYELERYKNNKELKKNTDKNTDVFTKEQNKELNETINKKLKNNYNKLKYLKQKIKLIKNIILNNNKTKTKKLTYTDQI